MFRVYGTISLGLRFQDVLDWGVFLATIELKWDFPDRFVDV
jgi:hypothetical protein